MYLFLIINVVVALCHVFYFKNWAKKNDGKFWDYLDFISDGKIPGEFLYLFSAILVIMWFVIFIFGFGYYISNS